MKKKGNFPSSKIVKNEGKRGISFFTKKAEKGIKKGFSKKSLFNEAFFPDAFEKAEGKKMENLKKCKNCKFYQADICHLPIWVEGVHYDGKITKAENTCDLFEESDALMTMVEE